ncbi:MAG TPA: EthD family reductase [Casimicrobiaceae bacterium]|nr:EthD family reductase [Casimicrobiaceae bacterium]
MAAAKLIVIYPMPKDVDAFERAYGNEHLPMAAPIFDAAGATKAVLTKIDAAPGTKALFHRIAEIHFPSLAVLNACAASQAGRDALADAARISNGGAPIVLIGSEDVVTFGAR